MNRVYLPHQILVHAKLSKFVSEFLGVLVSDRTVPKDAFPHGLCDIVRQWFSLDVESVVTVWGLPFEGPSLVV